MKDGRRQNGFNGVANAVAKVDEVTEASLALVNGYNVGLYGDGPDNNREKEFLGCRARLLCAAGIVDRRRLDSGEYFVITTL